MKTIISVSLIAGLSLMGCASPPPAEEADQLTVGKVQGEIKVGMDAASVARRGYRGTMRGKPIIVTGAMNWFRTQAIRFAPRALVRQVVKRVNRMLAGGQAPDGATR